MLHPTEAASPGPLQPPPPHPGTMRAILLFSEPSFLEAQPGQKAEDTGQVTGQVTLP